MIGRFAIVLGIAAAVLGILYAVAGEDAVQGVLAVVFMGATIAAWLTWAFGD